MTYYITFVILACALIALGLTLGVLSLRKPNRCGKRLGITMLSSSVSAIFYILFISQKDKMAATIFATCHFLLIDVALVAFLSYFVAFARLKFKKASQILFSVLIAYFVFEVVCFTINVFHPFVVDFILVEGREFAYYSLGLETLYYMHLAYCYLIVALLCAGLIYKIRITPKEYQGQFQLIMFFILAIIAVNAAFLFIPKDSILSVLDISILGYSIAEAFCYFITFKYSKTQSASRLKSIVFDDIGQGLVLFDYEGRFVLSNDIARDYFSDISLDEKLHINKFVDFCKMANIDESFDTYMFSVNIQRKGEKMPLRCTLRKIRDRKGKYLGRLFAFYDASRDIDFLTGFYHEEAFVNSVRNLPKNHGLPSCVLAVDINQLGVINAEKGHAAGDEAVKQLANALRDSFPADSFFVRCADAILCVVLKDLNEEKTLSIMMNLAENLPFSINYCTVGLEQTSEAAILSIPKAIQGLKVKKLLDPHASRSAYLASLMRALQECDTDTEMHVQRTGNMMHRLCRQMKLTDADEANLALLSVLHDIGKIGVPLEILNKISKLSNEEFAIVKTHAIKGYNICKSSPELVSIADGVRHHHERFDGKGYPDGLKGEDIPLSSRMIAVVDSFDAMTHDRVYRKGMSTAEAIAELERCAGTQFDPKVVSDFIAAIYETGEPIAEALPESKPVTVVEEELPMKEVIPLNYVHYYLGEDERIVGVSDNFAALTGYTEVEAIGMCQFDFIPKDELDEYLSVLKKYLGKDQIGYFRHHIVRKDGAIIEVACLGRRYYDSVTRSGHAELFVVPMEDFQK